jgi:hypothetical protein
MRFACRTERSNYAVYVQPEGSSRATDSGNFCIPSSQVKHYPSDQAMKEEGRHDVKGCGRCEAPRAVMHATATPSVSDDECHECDVSEAEEQLNILDIDAGRGTASNHAALGGSWRKEDGLLQDSFDKAATGCGYVQELVGGGESQGGAQMRQVGDQNEVYIDEDDGSSGSLFGTPPGATRETSIQSDSYTDGDDDF